MKWTCLLLFAWAFPHFSFAQQEHTPSEELQFTRYLIENKQLNDAVYVLKGLLRKKEAADPALADSIHYYLGWTYFSLKLLDSSSYYLSKVKEAPFYPKSPFYCAFNKAFLSQTGSAKKFLDSIPLNNDSSLIKLRNFQMACIDLLERNYTGFEERSGNFTYGHFAMAEEEKKLMGCYTELKRTKRRSPLLAGMMSAVLPGSGKFYAGYKGQGIAALMTVGILGISAAESYYRLGPRSPHFITFGSLFTIFYVGNIWGSAVSVKLARDKQFRDTNDQILFDMHIPLRRIFN